MYKFFVTVFLILFSSYSYAEEDYFISRHVSLNSWDQINNFSESDEITRAGNISWRLELNRGDCDTSIYKVSGRGDCTTDRERVEIRHYGGKKNGPNGRWTTGQDKWMSVSVYVPEDVNFLHQPGTSIIQVSGYPRFKWGGVVRTYSIAQIYIRNKYVIACVIQPLYEQDPKIADEMEEGCTDTPLMRTADMRGKWTDFVIRFKDKEEELIQFFVNGEMVYEEKNWMKHKHTKKSGQRAPYGFRYGIYRAFQTQLGVDMGRQVLYFDEARIGDSYESVAVNTDNPVN